MNLDRPAVARCLASSGQSSAAGRFSSCGSWYMETCPECGAEVRPKQNRCKMRICPDCAARESRKRFAILRPMVLHLSNRKRGLWRFITVTIRNPGDGGDPRRIRRQLQRCGKAVYKLWRNLLSKAGPNVGAACNMEVGPSGNVHMHMLHFGDFVDWRKMRRMWRRLTGSYIIEVRRCRGDDLDGLMASLAEVTKYICDPSKTDYRLLAAINRATRGLRCFRTYGTLFDQGDDDFEATHPTCPACLYQGRMDHGRTLCDAEADAWESALPHVRFTGCRAPPSTLATLMPGLFEPG